MLTGLGLGVSISAPRDRLYGVACLAQSSIAIRRLYEIKGRDAAKPVAICVSEVDDIPKYTKLTVPQELIRELLPGPVTVVLERSTTLNPELNPATNLVGVRVSQLHSPFE